MTSREEAPIVDRFERPLRALRVSLTDRCNLRCECCMPEEEYGWLPRGDVLTEDEIVELVGLFVAIGVEKARLTGGEPLLRPGVPALVRRIAGELSDLALTTNGVLLAEQAGALAEAGLERLTVSLATLHAGRFASFARRDLHGRVLAGLAAAKGRFRELKLDTVVVRGFNDDELAELVCFARELGAELRFIEYMDVGGATRWSPARVVGRDEIGERIAQTLGPVRPLGRVGAATAERFVTGDGTVFGVIPSVTAPFCGSCDRARLTADGLFFLCLHGVEGVPLGRLLRSGASGDELRERLITAWRRRDDRGAERQRGLEVAARLIPREALRRDPHLEMHTRGG